MDALALPTDPRLAQIDPLGRAWSESKTAIRSLQDDRGPVSDAKRAQIEKAAVEFEAVFLSQMLAPMFEQLETDGLFGGGSGERMYRSLLVQEYGRALAANGGVGIADAVTRQVLALQEVER